ncbi:MAG TPA: hypothetical protein P5509_05430 [Bacteroidales bacterium]|nr:hypothetical protein [Bacteroidales bacterium]
MEKRIPTLDDFILNERKYEGTWVPDINDAKMQDKFDKKAGGTGYKYQRALVQNIDPDKLKIDWEKATDREISSYLIATKKSAIQQWNDEHNYKQIKKVLEQINMKGNLNVYIGRDYVGENDKVRFFLPCLMNAISDKKKALEFIKDAEKLTLDVTDRNVPEKFTVVYSGTIKNGNETVEFNKVDNGFANWPG